MREISEAEAEALAGNTVARVLAKVENDATESAVCLKKLESGFLLGVSSETKNGLKLYWFDTERQGYEAFHKHANQMDITGFPFID